MTTLNPDEFLLLCDLETTGLDPKDDIVLEAGFIVTTLDFKPVEMFHSLVQPGYEIYWDGLNGFVRDMHEASGLRHEIDKGCGNELRAVEMDLIEWYENLFGREKAPLVGSSIGFDKGFIKEHFSQFEDLIHYRVIDFSSVKELCRRYNPEVYAKLPEARKLHRSIPDIEDTIGEARFYVDNFLFTTRPEVAA